MWSKLFLLAAGLELASVPGWPAGQPSGEQVAVVFNSKLPESRAVAEHYAQLRKVPAQQVFGLDMSTGETVTRAEFRENLQGPILRELEQRRLLNFAPGKSPDGGAGGDTRRKVESAPIRYLLLCYGVPIRILKDPSLKEEGQDKVRAELQRNEASVDSELALLPRIDFKDPLFGPLRNPYYSTTNASVFHPTNGVLMVARLDGPSAAIAEKLVDKALLAETDGLWGRAYIDSRGLTNGDYKLGDDWMRASAEICRRTGFETVLDTRPETFGPGYPLSQIAVYAGWYDGHVSGPFLQPQMEFMPGAFAYHLHSFSAQVVRTTSQHWVGPLLARGATITMGCVDEPYLEGTPDIAIFLYRLIAGGFTFGEAAYAAQGSLSWQTTVIGDPLYRPFSRQPPEQHAELEAHHSPLLEWSMLKLVNIRLAQGDPPQRWIELLGREPLVSKSAVLQEKLGDLCQASGKVGDAIDAYEACLKLSPSPQQKLRLTLFLPRLLANYRREKDAVRMLQTFLRESPDYPDRLGVYQKLLSVAIDAGDSAEVDRCRQEIEKLTPRPASKPQN